MEYVELRPQRRGRKGVPPVAVVFVVMSMVMACNLNFVGCLNTNKVEALCNAASYEDVGRRAEHLGKLVKILMELTPELHFEASARYPLWTDVDAWYGCAACNGHLSWADCGACLKTISDAYVEKACKGRFGMTVKLMDCRMRFEHYKFDGHSC